MVCVVWLRVYTTLSCYHLQSILSLYCNHFVIHFIRYCLTLVHAVMYTIGTVFVKRGTQLLPLVVPLAFNPLPSARPMAFIHFLLSVNCAFVSTIVLYCPHLVDHLWCHPLVHGERKADRAALLAISLLAIV